MRTAVYLLLVSCTLRAQEPGAAGKPPSSGDDIPSFGTTVVISGFRGDIYHLHHWIKRLPDFTKMKPVGSIYTHTLNVPPQHFDKGFPGVTDRKEWFAIQYEARFWVQTAGTYRFRLVADDGADLYIDDRLVIDNDGQHTPKAKEEATELSAGMHRIRVPYYQGPKWEVALVLQVARPGQGFAIFNTEEFLPPAGATDWK